MPKKVPMPKTQDALVFVYNPAPVLDPEEKDKDQPNRENTAWYISIPSLGICVRAEDPDTGEPIVSYWNLNDALLYASNLYYMLLANPEYLADLRTRPEWSPPVRNQKVMWGTIRVPA